MDTNSRLDSVLALSSVNLPGGELRRRSAEDELSMRRYLQEGDIISAEVSTVPVRYWYRTVPTCHPVLSYFNVRIGLGLFRIHGAGQVLLIQNSLLSGSGTVPTYMSMRIVGTVCKLPKK